MWKKKENYNESLRLTDGTSIFSPVSQQSARSITTRSMGRVRASPEAQSTPGAQDAAVIALASLFASPPFPNEQINDTLEDEAEGDEIPEMDDRLPCFDVITNIQAAVTLQTSPKGSESSQSTGQTSVDPFRQAFGTPAGNPGASLDHLIQVRSQLYRPMLDKEIRAIPCSTLSRHLWSHCQDMSFSCKEEVSAWCRKTMQLEIISAGSALSYMKTAGTKWCRLCMKERIALFRHFGKKKTRTKNLMNSRKEMHGKCSCKTRFIRLRSIENEGADDALISRK